MFERVAVLFTMYTYTAMAATLVVRHDLANVSACGRLVHYLLYIYRNCHASFRKARPGDQLNNLFLRSFFGFFRL